MRGKRRCREVCLLAIAMRNAIHTTGDTRLINAAYTGKADTLEEKPFDTARREACEEIGLPTTDTKLPPGFKVEHLCELPANLAKTELGVRPCVAFLCPSAQDGSATDAVEEKMIPRLDPKEVAAVFTAPFHNFLRKGWEGAAPGPKNPDGKPHSWYRGSWTDWHESRWRMHNFYIPRPPPSSTQLLQNPAHTPSPSSSPSASSA
jgi:hypothetical protein